MVFGGLHMNEQVLKSINLKMPENLHKHLKLQAVASGKTISNLLIEKIRNWMQESEAELLLNALKNAPIQEEDVSQATLDEIEEARKDDVEYSWEEFEKELKK